ncbi:MAG: hypothetical protein RLZZ58_1269, partial [Pseudomonadota bacterium]
MIMARDDPAVCGMVTAADAAVLAQRAGSTLPDLALTFLPFAAAYAAPPISRYCVGAVVVGASGALYYGANLEVAGAALAFTLHAEQAAIANAWMHGETGVSAIAISAAPCGYCRQFLHELTSAASLLIALPGAAPASLALLLPHAFGPADLGQTGGLMDPADHDLTVTPPPDMLTAAALAAANMAYSPYTSTFSGVALRSASGRIVSGAYAENAAFNPSLSPLAIALSQLVL